MFNFNEDKLKAEQVIKIAEQDGIPPLRVAINANGYRQSTPFWGALDVSSIYKGSELEVLIKTIGRMGVNGKGVIGIRSLYEVVRKVKPFVGREIRLMMRLQEDLIPELDRLNVTCRIGDKIYINPAVLDLTWKPEFKVYEGEHSSRLPYHLRYSEEEVEVAMEFLSES